MDRFSLAFAVNNAIDIGNGSPCRSPWRDAKGFIGDDDDKCFLSKYDLRLNATALSLNDNVCVSDRLYFR